jgi:hypothetical protein
MANKRRTRLHRRHGDLATKTFTTKKRPPGKNCTKHEQELSCIHNTSKMLFCNKCVRHKQRVINLKMARNVEIAAFFLLYLLDSDRGILISGLRRNPLPDLVRGAAEEVPV